MTELDRVSVTLLDGTATTFGALRKPVTLVVNVASRCGLAPQYEALESLQRRYADRGFTVIGFPSNQFLQELGSTEAIAEYCSMTWGVSFPMSQKISVNGRKRDPLYAELVKSKYRNGLGGPIKWNFEKFVLTPDGAVHRFAPQTEPDDAAIVGLIEANLPATPTT
ncbi:MAG TPA: glutathione peroxidase [Microbacteriaceae bacterium]|nr:glutathione peroxidase [Microbacteriaceae bacterium]